MTKNDFKKAVLNRLKSKKAMIFAWHEKDGQVKRIEIEFTDIGLTPEDIAPFIKQS